MRGGRLAAALISTCVACGGGASTSTDDAADGGDARDAVPDAFDAGSDAPARDAPDAEVDAAASPCPDGATLLLDRTDCPASSSASLDPSARDAIVAASSGEVVSTGALPASIPCAPVVVCTAADAPTLFFSDDPESPTGDGVLYADRIGPGKIRIFVYHTNGGAGSRKFPVVVLDEGDVDAHVVVTARGLAGPSTQYVSVGKQAIVDWMSPKAPRSVVVPAHTRVLLDADLDALHAAHDELVHAIYDLEVDAPVKISTVSVASDVDAASATASLSLLPNDGAHTRGTFPGADLVVVSTRAVDASGLRRLVFGESVSDVDLPGTDAVDGTTVALGGDYGVLYRMQLSTSAPTSFFFSPRGGAWAAALDLAPDVVPLPSSSESIPDATHGGVAGRFSGTASFRWMTAGGSSLPVDLVAVP